MKLFLLIQAMLFMPLALGMAIISLADWPLYMIVMRCFMPVFFLALIAMKVVCCDGTVPAKGKNHDGKTH